jgi:magnesium-transporting ATPase (P-type)
MSVLAIDTEDMASNDYIWALTKGSPETIMPLLDPKSVDQEVYSQLYKRQMALGRRVLALAYQNLGKNTVSNLDKWMSSRDKVERNLVFAGLLIMDSPLKADSSRIIKELRAGQQTIVMVTGDAALTAAEVARKVGIIDAPENATYEVRIWTVNYNISCHSPLTLCASVLALSFRAAWLSILFTQLLWPRNVLQLYSPGH